MRDTPWRIGNRDWQLGATKYSRAGRSGWYRRRGRPDTGHRRPSRKILVDSRYHRSGSDHVRQWLQAPQPQQNGTVTRCPIAHLETFGPTLTMRPANSWPRTWGGITVGSCPCQACQSLRHIPLASTWMTTPSGGVIGSSTRETESGPPKVSKIAAFMLLAHFPAGYGLGFAYAERAKSLAIM